MNVKKWILFCVIGLMVGTGLLRSSSDESSRKLMIATVKDKEIKEYEIALLGFKELLVKENISANYEIYDEYDPALLPKLKTLKPDLILTIGGTATKKITAEIKDIPIVFSMVMDPKGKGITSNNVSGSSLDIPVKLQLETIKSVLPKLNRIGLIYNPVENETIIQEAQTVSKELGFTLKTYPVRFEREIPRLRDLQIDILWIIPDSTVCTKETILTRLLQSGVKSQIAVIGFSRFYAKAGAFMGISCDYMDIGRQAAEIAIKIVKGEKNPELKITVPRKVTFYLNRTTAKLLDISLPESIIKKASEVY